MPETKVYYVLIFQICFKLFHKLWGEGVKKIIYCIKRNREIFLSLIDQFCLIKIPKGKEFQQGQKNNDWLKPGVKLLSQNNYVCTYSYNSIKRICSIKRPGLEFFKNILLSVPYHR